MFDPIAIANYFVSKSWEKGEELTPMKLVKLVYIAHGYHLAITETPLLTESAVAWKYGPVIQSVYHAFKSYGTEQITAFQGQRLNNTDWHPDNIDNTTKRFIDIIWDHYRGLNGFQLSTLTHQPDTPWYQTWHGGGCNQKNAVIPNDLIATHYKKLIDEQRRKQQPVV